VVNRRAWAGVAAILFGSLLTHCTALIGLGDEPTLETDASNPSGTGGAGKAGAGGSPTAGASGSQTGGRGGNAGSGTDASVDGTSGSGGTAGAGGTAGGAAGSSGAAGKAGAGGMMGDGGCPSCNQPCTTDADCPGAWCDTTRTPRVCAPKKPVGMACTGNDNNQCVDGHCVDGYCCDTTCAGQCEACNVGTPGTCSQVIGAPHPGKTACAGTGMCAASCSASRTMCTFPTIQCRAPTCSGTTLTLGASCDGAGNCPAVMTMTCANGCNLAGNACNVPCSTDAGCPPGNWCDPTSGQCQPKKANGQKCGADNQCQLAHCVDTYCCDGLCNGQCEACDVATVEGTCSQVNGAPHAGKTACTGTANCAGSCSGSRTACTFPAVQCRAQTCASGTVTNAANCSAGSCPGVTTTSCNGFTCNGPGCTGSCDQTNDTGCLTGNFCNGGTQCLSTRPIGRACTANNQCTNNTCVDGYCCNGPCSGGCDVCNATPGSCTPLAANSAGVGCGNYLCQGGNACPTACTASTQCVAPTFCNTTTSTCGTCFVAGTPVETESGLRAIETIEPGVRVRAFDTAAGEASFRVVKRLEKRIARALVSVHIQGAPAIHVSPEHYFWVAGSGWVRAAELTMDDRLLGQGREARQVEALEMLAVPEYGVPVYNLVVDGFDDYFVGETPVLVHSCDYMNFSAVARERLPE
jgi:hypothetical protein